MWPGVAYFWQLQSKERISIKKAIDFCFGELRDPFRILPGVLDAGVTENLQACRMRIFHEKEGYSVADVEVAGRQQLAVALVVGEDGRIRADDAQESWLTAAVLNVAPACFRWRSPAVQRRVPLLQNYEFATHRPNLSSSLEVPRRRGAEAPRRRTPNRDERKTCPGRSPSPSPFTGLIHHLSTSDRIIPLALRQISEFNELT